MTTEWNLEGTSRGCVVILAKGSGLTREIRVRDMAGPPPKRRGPGLRVDPPDQPPMRKTFPPHIGQVPEIAGLPFFIVIRCGFWTSTFLLSLTQ